MKVSRRVAIAAVAIIVTGCEHKVDTLAQPEQANTTASIVQPFKDRRVTNPFPGATEVRLFVEVSYTKDDKPILSKRNGVRLNAAQRKAFEDSLKITAAPEYDMMCFIPHHFFRYYDARGQEIGTVSVCFCCDGVEASGSKALEPPDSATLNADYRQLKALVAALGEPTDILCD
ncbi:hypothetical protein J2Y54_002316 [Sphingomonas sp. BE123]|jgi:hypothetical protein|uniref:hypothetical protein n=1 Tax=Sphingomonas sp. BE123 TaxID=2817842 RepID=UPI00285BB974|nr:hypothetical protein [Sphingomonas sp. BE123]MDR6852796.1 hypothetical protein [Sphingomonas sp. BE123]